MIIYSDNCLRPYILKIINHRVTLRRRNVTDRLF